ncbi:hypothetical protein KP509_16G013900 [Ceratopteris richardii]|uniref:Uncharacterized protein n=1 Tax=Ceratopteris richardii TaxID=49495 RepID=A0A8T2SYV3_CERRI|nr:hypothetical protein KP509_16G013900 [Ceratopteris richardii]
MEGAQKECSLGRLELSHPCSLLISSTDVHESEIMQRKVVLITGIFSLQFALT